jgi:hypothetical protein
MGLLGNRGRARSDSSGPLVRFAASPPSTQGLGQITFGFLEKEP